MKGIAGIALVTVITILSVGTIIGTPPTLDYLEEARVIDLPEENPAVFRMERFGESFRETFFELNKTQWRERRLSERMGEFVELWDKSRKPDYAEFREDIERNMEYMWREIENRTNMTREEIIETAKQKLEEELDKLKQIETAEDCERVYGDRPRIECVGRWKIFPVWDFNVCYWACEMPSNTCEIGKLYTSKEDCYCPVDILTPLGNPSAQWIETEHNQWLCTPIS